MKKFKRPNIFMILVVIAGFGVVFRLADIAFAVEESKEQPPPLTKEDVVKSVADTTKALDAMPSAQPEASGPKVELPATPPSTAAVAYSTCAPAHGVTGVERSSAGIQKSSSDFFRLNVSVGVASL